MPSAIMANAPMRGIDRKIEIRKRPMRSGPRFRIAKDGSGAPSAEGALGLHLEGLHRGVGESVVGAEADLRLDRETRLEALVVEHLLEPGPRQVGTHLLECVDEEQHPDVAALRER